MKTVKFVLKQTIPIWPSYIFVGIAAGVLLREAGYPIIWALLSGLLIYAGSMQIVMVTLMTGGTPLYMVALMTLFINARHIFYGIGMIDRFRRQGWKCPYMALTLTDETYSVLCNLKCPEELESKKVDFLIMLFCHILWTASCALGALCGGLIPFDMTGIGFSATAFFTVVVVNQWMEFGSKIPAVAGFISAAVFRLVFGADNFILPALSVSVIVLVVMRDRIQLKMKAGEAV